MTQKSQNLSFGDLCVADFGKIVDHCIAGIRPCMVVKMNRKTVVVIPITSDKGNHDNEEILIPRGTGNLRKDSKMKVYQIRTLDISSLQKKLGRLNRKYQELVRKAIRKNLIE